MQPVGRHRHATALVLTALLGPLVAGCGGATTPSVPADSGPVVLLAKNIEFQPASLKVPSGANFVVTFQNRDIGVPHNLALMGDANFSTTILESEVVLGPADLGLIVPGLVPGEYRFTCVVHPNMTAQLLVAAP